jgi:hypothetical protein
MTQEPVHSSQTGFIFRLSSVERKSTRVQKPYYCCSAACGCGWLLLQIVAGAGAGADIVAVDIVAADIIAAGQSCVDSISVSVLLSSSFLDLL